MHLPLVPQRVVLAAPETVICALALVTASDARSQVHSLSPGDSFLAEESRSAEPPSNESAVTSDRNRG